MQVLKNSHYVPAPPAKKYGKKKKEKEKESLSRPIWCVQKSIQVQH
jgi:hypothetical protein